MVRNNHFNWLKPSDAWFFFFLFKATICSKPFNPKFGKASRWLVFSQLLLENPSWKDNRWIKQLCQCDSLPILRLIKQHNFQTVTQRNLVGPLEPVTNLHTSLPHPLTKAPIWTFNNTILNLIVFRYSPVQ